MKKTWGVLFVLAICVPLLASTMYRQTTASCFLSYCDNAVLGDGEKFSYTDSIVYYGAQNFGGAVKFRGVAHHDFYGKLTYVGRSNEFTTLWNLNGTFGGGHYKIHEYFAVSCYRSCVQKNLAGSLTTGL